MTAAGPCGGPPPGGTCPIAPPAGKMGLPRRAILWTLGPDGYGLPLDPAHETQARLPMGLTVTARTQMLDFSLEGPEGCINLAYTLLDRGLPLSRMQLTIRITKET